MAMETESGFMLQSERYFACLDFIECPNTTHVCQTKHSDMIQLAIIRNNIGRSFYRSNTRHHISGRDFG